MSRLALILGMHRSGTSCLAGCLRACGLWLGPVADGGSEHNPRGNQELQSVTALNQDLLQEAGGGWNRAPSAAHHPSWRLQRRLSEMTALITTAPIAGIKDPLLLLVLQHWLAQVPHADLIGTFRHPIEVARSLEARQAISRNDALDTWLLYNTELVHWHQRQRFTLIEYDLRPPRRYLELVSHLARGLDLEPDLEAMATFAAPALQHQRSDEPVPALCVPVYDYLRAHCLDVAAR